MPAPTPAISILMPMYNAAPFLADALDSLLSQTFPDFELLLLDDGSADASPEIAAIYARRDPRIRLSRQPNQGVVPALNTLLAQARAPLIARMDADDIALPHRLQTQAAYLDAHPAVIAVGSAIQTFTTPDLTASPGPNPATKSPPRIIRHPANPHALTCALIFRNPLAHPSIMARRHALLPGYDPRARHVEDYALWIALASRHGPDALANIDDVLLHYRLHPHSISARHAPHQRTASVALQIAFLQQRLAISPTPHQIALHEALAFNDFPPTPLPNTNTPFTPQATAWLHLLAHQNATHHAFPEPHFTQTLAARHSALERQTVPQ